jgi:hypothetical protein
VNEPTDWGVFVNEVKIMLYGNREPANWWVTFGARYGPHGRITMLDITPIAGGHYHVAFDTKDDAEFARQHMIAQGIHPTFVEVKTLTACRQAVRAKHAKYQNSIHPGTCKFCAPATREAAAA